MNWLVNEPERGATGDHGQAGQDGRDGADGRTGPRGPAGAAGAAGDASQGERGVRGKAGGSTPALRIRMMVLYIVMVLVLAAVGYMYQRSEASDRAFKDSIIANCQANRTNTVNFNDFIDTLVATYRKSPVLSKKEVEERVAFFQRAKGVVPQCPPDGSR